MIHNLFLVQGALPSYSPSGSTFATKTTQVPRVMTRKPVCENQSAAQVAAHAQAFESHYEHLAQQDGQNVQKAESRLHKKTTENNFISSETEVKHRHMKST